MADDSAEQRSGYLPGLDGIRAIAVGSVVAYHLGVPHFDGGLLGVSVFFTLSGYLITSLLVRGYEQHGRVDLKNFWIRRARRLLPALVLMLPVVVVTTAIARPDKLVATGRQALYALMYVANWTTIANGDDYFQRFASPGPLDHLWSLAIEEQFYIVWPLLVLALLAIGRKLGATRVQRVPLAFVTIAFTLASTWAISHLYDPHGLNNTRAYEGTDARAASLLIGALFALALPFEKVGTITSRASRIVLDVFGLFGLAGIALIIAKTDEYSPFLYTGGEISLSLCTAMAAMAAAHPAGVLARALGILPLRWVGARSYGVYLWHMPVCAFMPASVLIDKPMYRGLVQVGLIFVLAAASFRLIEDPIRRRVQAPKRARRRLAFSAAGFVPLAIVSLVVWPLSCRPASSPDLEAVVQDPDPPPVSTTMVESAIPAPTTTALAAITLTPDMLATSCKEVAHVGDSTSLGLVSKVLLPNESDQIAARYRGVGVERFFSEISGARSMVEKYKDQPNATEIVKRRHESGYKGCYVMALGTNDPANTSGNQQMLSQRIDTMMAQIGDVPALWTTTKTLKDKGPYQNSHMASWNETLVKACARHPNMRVYDWATEVQDAWFTPDGIHFNTPGYKERAIRISKALAHAFPREGTPPADCVVHAAD